MLWVRLRNFVRSFSFFVGERFWGCVFVGGVGNYYACSECWVEGIEL